MNKFQAWLRNIRSHRYKYSPEGKLFYISIIFTKLSRFKLKVDNSAFICLIFMRIDGFLFISWSMSKYAPLRL